MSVKNSVFTIVSHKSLYLFQVYVLMRFLSGPAWAGLLDPCCKGKGPEVHSFTRQIYKDKHISATQQNSH